MASDQLLAELKRLHDRAKDRYHELGVVDGLLLGNRLLHEAGMCEAGHLLMRHAEELLTRLDAELEAATLMDRVAKIAK